MCQVWLYEDPEYIIGKAQWQQNTSHLQHQVQFEPQGTTALTVNDLT